MALAANRRSVMTLFSGLENPDSHRTRFVMAEKDITVDIIDIDPDETPEELAELNPYNSVPTLIDRDLVLYDARCIIEYLDERFPHPPLMPIDPVSRARSRLALFRIETDWYGLIDDLEKGTGKDATKARKILKESLLSAAEIFEAKPYFLSDEIGILDCTIAPMLWRLPRWGIELPKQAKPIMDYCDRIFSRDTFQQSLTDVEREMRS